MDKPNSEMARQIAKAAFAFEQQRTGNTPTSVTVVLSDTTLVITLHGALSEAERTVAKSPRGGRSDTGLSPAIVRQRLRVVAAGDQADHWRGGA